MKEQSKKILRLVFLTLGLHLITSLVFILLNGTIHPLYNLLKGWPLILQVIISSVFSFLIYIVPGYLFIIGLRKKDLLIKSIDRLVLVVSTILLVFFVVSFVYAMILYSKQGWLIYATANPLSGLLIYNLFDTKVSLWDLLWSISALIPALGMMLGMYLRLKKEGLVK